MFLSLTRAERQRSSIFSLLLNKSAYYHTDLTIACGSDAVLVSGTGCVTTLIATAVEGGGLTV
jgi:hypothetical protein